MYPTYEYNQMQVQFPLESTQQIMARLGYEYNETTKLWYNAAKDRWGKSWVRWGSYGKQLKDGIFFGTGYKKNEAGELWFDYDEEIEGEVK